MPHFMKKLMHENAGFVIRRLDPLVQLLLRLVRQSMKTITFICFHQPFIRQGKQIDHVNAKRLRVFQDKRDDQPRKEQIAKPFCIMLLYEHVVDGKIRQFHAWHGVKCNAIQGPLFIDRNQPRLE